LVDKGEEPLLIDQPEGNLDNETVFSLLVPSIKQAKLHRQIIMVTHNPNLAVVCDAEQLVIAERGVHPDVQLKYRSGAIENSDIREGVLNILEGTEPAFLNREGKYLR
jgi:predicted ATPase